MADPSAVDLVRQRFAESLEASHRVADDVDLASGTAALAALGIESLRAGGKVLVMGNGGSAADATHLAAELVGRYRIERDPLAALSLTDNGSSVTAIGNDYEYDEVFARQVRGLGRPGDLAIGLSTAAITGEGGGALAAVADLCLRMPASETARVQECSMVVIHTFCELVEAALAAR
jgi:D-sedoheptulose 7-phosphate isomerase